MIVDNVGGVNIMARKTGITSDRPYHHGNLRQALLDAALELLQAGDEQGVSLRTVAARAGVSNGAPYRHFQDREALMAAVATVGFERLLQSLLQARESAGEGAEMQEMATAYLAFASKNAGLYRVMFTENHLAIRYEEGLARSSTAAFQILQDAIDASAPTTHGKENSKQVATAIWAGLHGTALLASGRLIPVGGPTGEGHAEAEGAAVARLLIERFSEPRRPPQRRSTDHP
jgi:AcrR family transcriptional regulator